MKSFFCINTFKVPTTIVQKPIAADLIIFFTTEESAPNVLGFAAACEFHPVTMRPIAGRVNLNPAKLKLDKVSRQEQFDTTLHEIYHIMGFTPYLFQFFIDPVTNKRKNVSDTYIQRQSGAFRNQVVSPRVLEFARNHFGCQTMIGVPLEDHGATGSISSHWEKVVAGNEIMVANRTPNIVNSELTMRLLEDSGWYQVNRKFAEPLVWGRNLGCAAV